MKTYKDIHEIIEYVDSHNGHEFPSKTLGILKEASENSPQEELDDFVDWINQNKPWSYGNDHWSEILISNPQESFSCFKS